MTPTTDTNSQPSTSYPTEWHDFDVLREVKVRQESEDSFYVKTPVYYAILSKKDFNYYRNLAPYDAHEWFVNYVMTRMNDGT